MALPVLDQQVLNNGSDVLTSHVIDSMTTTVNDEIIIVEFASGKNNATQTVSSVTSTGTATVGAFSKLTEVTTVANGTVSIWWAHQTVAGTVIVTINMNTSNVSLTTDGWIGIVSSYTGAAASQAAAAVASSVYTTVQASVTQALTTTAPDSLVRSCWHDYDVTAGTTEGNNLNGASTAQRWFNGYSAMTTSQWIASYTGSTATPGSKSQVYSGFTSPSFKGIVVAYEILAGGTVLGRPFGRVLSHR